MARAAGTARGLIVRIDPLSSLIDTDRRTEYLTMEAMYRAGLPVAEPLLLEEDSRWLGRPFSISAEVPGCEASPEGIPAGHRVTMGRQLWCLLGEIARLDPLALGLDRFMSLPTVATCAMEQLEYWRKVIVDDELHPNPVADAAVRWLLKHPPPPPQKLSLVHGDYRTGNFLYTPDGTIKAIVDWEMAHIGDPLEDLAWSLDPLWHWQQPELAGRLLPHAEAVRHWEEASGIELDVEAFRWWRIFASLKGMGIWISSSEDFHNGASKDPILAIAGWLMTDRQQQILLDYLRPAPTRRFHEVMK
ncbi:aminoglycoside phosphotransferase [Chelatococcus reniformis]|uniref:Aminoglycoside phosphotransferase n=1 Tax=Chelatococcus reniformis TaxID=1494448 RepID=A0A916TZR9_9HYPH|nr:aminoglycoside phosphotransferase [Chelatococcus reniformis]